MALAISQEEAARIYDNYPDGRRHAHPGAAQPSRA